MQKLFSKKSERGVALLFTVLLTSALLLVALGVANVSYKELTFSLEGRDSDAAFFAADTGVECALYLNAQGPISQGLSPVFCQKIHFHILGNASLYTFVLSLYDTNRCAYVTIEPHGTGPDPKKSYTVVRSYGYNVVQQITGSSTCVSASGASSSRIVSRALLVRVENP